MPRRAIADRDQLMPLLSRAVARQTLPLSLVFAGPRGVTPRLQR